MNWLLFFFYIYPIRFVGIPLTTRLIFSIIGIGQLVLRRKLPKDFFSVLSGLAPIAMVSVVSGLLNRTFDFTFLFYAISNIAIFCSGYFLLSILQTRRDEDSSSNIIMYMVVSICVQTVLTLFINMWGELGEFMSSFIVKDGNEIEVIEKTIGNRFIGFGTSFFGAGAVSGLGLILIVYLYLSNERFNILWGVFAYISVLIVGIMLARTTLLGLLVSLLFLCCWRWKNINLLRRKIKWLLLFIIILVLMLVLTFNFVDSQILLWAFELFFNWLEYGRFTSDSTEQLQGMYIWPDSLTTYLIGDGFYNLKDGYYMGTDVGYLRLLFYGGIPIVAAFFFYPIWIIYKTMKLGISPMLSYLLMTLFFYVLLLNMKGLIDLNFVFILIYMITYLRKKVLNMVTHKSLAN